MGEEAEEYMGKAEGENATEAGMYFEAQVVGIDR